MHNYIHPIQQHHLTTGKVLPEKAPVGKDFKQVLSEAGQVKLSKHARLRLEERNIQIDEHKWDKVGKKMLEAKQKGVTDAVVIVDNVTFVASTKNNTIITALHQEETNNKIFTNINGTIII